MKRRRPKPRYQKTSSRKTSRRKRKPLLDLIGLGYRAGSVIVGSERARDALKRGKVVLLVVANDRSERVRNKVERVARAVSVPIVSGASAAEIGGAVGRGPTQVLGIRDRKLAAGIQAVTNGDVR